ncbi:N6-adenosine-methyltransferase non-catalytic subunit MTB-like [Primulina huaijiensis]|uniref:N6-adenosine-methyltransferase non-catalytic subunit MTB-like n=1 Tax=Primulina huaijiensis TaxID=1492673 RepID=UPI003CC75CCD
MDSLEYMRNVLKQDIDDDVEVDIDKVRDADDWNGEDVRKHRSGKSRKIGSVEGVDGFDSSGIRISTSDRHESRKRMGGSVRGDSDQDECERKHSHSKQTKKIPEENTLHRLSTWYQDGEVEHKLEGRDMSGSKGYRRAEESERGKSTTKHSEHEFDLGEVADKDSKYSQRTDSDREKGYGYVERGRRSQSRWDESDAVVKANNLVERVDVGSGKFSDCKLGSMGERESDNLEIESTDKKIRDMNSINDEFIESRDGEERRVSLERSKERSSEERFEEYRLQINHIGGDRVYDSERSLDKGEDVKMAMRDTTRRDIEGSNMSRTPEKMGRHQFESGNFESDYERSGVFKRKEQVKNGSWDEKAKSRDDSWVDKNRNRQNFKGASKRRQDKETGDSGTGYGNSREWELPRRGCEWTDGEYGRSGGRKDGSRTEAVKTSSKYGISNENYDVIEIRTKPFDHGVDDSSSTFAQNREIVQQSHAKLASDIDHRSVQSGEESKDKIMDGCLAMQDHNSWRDDTEFRSDKFGGQNSVSSNRGDGGQGYSIDSVPPHANQENGFFNRSTSQGFRGNRIGRAGRGRPTGRDSQQFGFPIPLVGSPFGQLGIPPHGPIQSLAPNMSPAPGPPISPGVFIPPFQPAPIIWPGARGVEMNMLPVQPGFPPIPSGPLVHRFPPNVGNPQNSSPVFNSLGPGKGTPPSMPGPNFNAIAPMVRGQLQDKSSGGWLPSRSDGPPGRAPSRGEQNDYSQNFVDTGMRPQNYIRELELTSVVEDYPKLRDLIQRKDEIVAKSASHPMYYKCDLREQVLSQEFFGTKFDVILVDPPWEEYVHRAPGVTEHMEYWTFEEIMNLKIEAIADTPSFIFLWVGAGVGLEQGRQCLKKWGFRRCEDICWVKTNKTNATPGLRHDSHTLVQRSKEHCLMGIKGTVRRSTDGHIIHANIDTDVIIAEEPPYGSTAKPEDMYRIIEHFALGRRRVELFGEDHNIRSGWLTVGKGLSSSNFHSEAYTRNFADKDGKVWVGVGGRNPPPEASHLIQTTPEIESLRPKSPMKNQQQQQQSVSISLTTTNPGNRRPTVNSPQNHIANQETYSSSNIMSPAPRNSTTEMFRGRESGHFPPDDGMFDIYGYNASYGAGRGDVFDFESHRGMNMM